jgi:hypothetical protein
MTDLIALADEIETVGEGQQADRIWAAGAAIFGKDYEGETAQRFVWFAQKEAFLDAAMTLVPEGWEHGYLTDDTAFVYQRNENNGFGKIFDCDCRGKPPALALCAAALRARASMETGTHHGK